MEKRLTFETSNDKGIFLYTVGEGRDSGYLEKTASKNFHPQIAEYVANAKPIPGIVQVLLTALGASEYWGANVNGDSFPQAALKYAGPEYGYKTFESMAHVYKHHINKDPAKSYGKVALSVWNEKMKRVELIVTIEQEKAPDLVERIDNGEYPEVSMGCKVPYDVCSICGNKAKTRAQYCDHLRYHMNKIPPGHQKIASAVNTIPKFFDISFVLIGADRIAKVMKKVAHGSFNPKFGISSAQEAEVEKTAMMLGGSSAPSKPILGKGTLGVSKKPIPKSFLGSFSKRAGLGLNKRAEIEKEVPSNLSGNTVGKINDISAMANEGREALEPLEPSIDKKIIIHLADNNRGMEGLNKILSTLGMLGIMPKRDEFQTMVLRCLGKADLDEEYTRLGLRFSPQSEVSTASQCGCNESLDISPEKFDPRSYELLKDIIPDRSYARPVLAKRIIRLVKLAEQGNLEYPIEKTANEEEPGKLGLLPMMLTLTGLYIAMKNKLPASAAATSGIDKVLLNNPLVAASLGVGGVAGLSTLTRRTVKGQYDQNIDGNAMNIGSWQDEINRKNNNPIAKTASKAKAGSLAKRLFFGVPALYLASGAQEVKRARNPQRQESAIGGFIRKHPDVASAALVGEAMAGFPITKTVKNVARGGLKMFGKMKKMGSLSDDALSTAVFSLGFPGASMPLRAATTAIDYGIISGINKLLKKKKVTGGKNAKY